MCQFHQHFMSAFLPIFWCQKISNPKHSFVIFGAKILWEKCASKTLMKLTAGELASELENPNEHWDNIVLSHSQTSIPSLFTSGCETIPINSNYHMHFRYSLDYVSEAIPLITEPW